MIKNRASKIHASHTDVFFLLLQIVHSGQLFLIVFYKCTVGHANIKDVSHRTFETQAESFLYKNTSAYVHVHVDYGHNIVNLVANVRVIYV